MHEKTRNVPKNILKTARVEKKEAENLHIPDKSLTFAPQSTNGTLADRLGNGLQNRVEQFDSARYLSNSSMCRKTATHFFCCHAKHNSYHAGGSRKGGNTVSPHYKLRCLTIATAWVIDCAWSFSNSWFLIFFIAASDKHIFSAICLIEKPCMDRRIIILSCMVTSVFLSACHLSTSGI